jgi:hypothetical protein
MLKVRGSSYRPLFLPELGDTVFLGQVKTFTEEKLAQSPTLQDAVNTGKVVVLDRTGTLTTTPPPLPRIVPVTVAAALQVFADPPRVGSQVAPVDSCENNAPKPPSASDLLLASLVDKVTLLAKTLEDKHAQEAVGVSSNELADKLADIATRIDGMRVSGPGVQENHVLSNGASKDSIFVPSAIKVDDLTNNISLSTRSLGQGGSVNEAVAALRRARESSNGGNS